MKIEFSTRDYEWAYGKQPRGRGWWWFTFEGYEYSTCGTFTEARKACRDYIKSLAPKGYTQTVRVLVGT